MERRFLFLLVSLLLASSCIYDYAPVIEDSETVLVIEGDILVGGYTDVRLSFSRPLDAAFSEMSQTSWLEGAQAWVEASDGARYDGVGSRIDTRAADPSLDYRLLVAYKGKTYASEWTPVIRSAEIDSLSYTISDDRMTLTLEVSTHGGPDNLYYRWMVKEDWEYHTPNNASHYFVLGSTYDHGTFYKSSTILPFQDGENTYYCWNSGRVNDLLLASAEPLSENRLIRHPLYSLSCYDQRISFIYSMELTQESLSETAYRYWETMKRNSGDVGGLFSPEPFEMRGNIVNLEDPDEAVVGYISAAVPSTRRIFINSEKIGFARISASDREIYNVTPVHSSKKDWNKLYYAGYAVFVHTENGQPDEFDWLPIRCVDCRVWGKGTKNKPDFWPNNHK